MADESTPVHGSNEWIAQATDQELENLLAQGPSREMAVKVEFELSRRKDQRQERIARYSMRAGIGAAVAAVASAAIAIFQVVTPSDTELAQREQKRRTVFQMYDACKDRAHNLYIAIDIPTIDQQSTPKQIERAEELSRISERALTLNLRAMEEWVDLIDEIFEVRPDSQYELEVLTTGAVICLLQIEGYEREVQELTDQNPSTE